MLRSSLLVAWASLLAVGAAAQSAAPAPQISRDVHRVPGAVKHAGIYHAATGTWTRIRGNQANIGPDVVYNNSLESGYYYNNASGPQAGLEFFGTGNIPTAASNGSFATSPDRTRYTINCFEFAYCDFGTTPASSAWAFKFYDSATPCQDPTVAPVASLVFQNLPSLGLALPGNNGCWSVIFDLSGMEFCLEGDGGQLNPGWDLDNPDLDSFGYSIDYVGPAPNAGLLLAGDPDNDESGYNALNPNNGTLCNPAFCPAAPIPTGGNATYFNPPGLCNLPGAPGGAAPFRGTGRLTRDFWLATDGNPATNGAPEGCFYLGGYFNQNGCGGISNTAYASSYLVISAAAGECTSGTSIGGGTAYCDSNPNSTGVMSQLDIQGFREASFNNCVLAATSLPLNSFGFFVTSRNQGFVANPAGSQGNICLGANIGRFVAPGQIKNSGASGSIALSTVAGEWNLAAIPQATGPYAAMAGITSNFQLWHRDSSMSGATSNFTGGKSVTWL